MDRLALFIPLAKADAAQRLVYGSFDETPDRSGEVFDYATSKPLIEAWSGEIAKASDGKSFGNVRAQHGRNAAGKLVDITFDDLGKSVGFVAKIVDDDEWKKVEEGVYTGFSPGGRYAKRWQDGSVKRYTADVRELSIVDVPCNPSATFTMVKADGAEEDVSFALAKAYEPENAETVERADALAKAANKPDRRNDFVAKARAELIAENADAALAKMAEPAEEPAKVDPVDALAKALGAAAKVGALAVDNSTTLSDLAPRGRAIALLAKSVETQPILAKGMWTLQCVGRLMESVADIATSVSWEEKGENDTDSNLPQMALDLVTQVKAFLVEMANEETAELLASIKSNLPDFVIVVDGEEMELATSIVDLVKADTALMEKAGARNSKADQTKIQTMHDHSVSLGADCGPANKDALAALATDRDRLAKAVEDTVPQVEALTDRLQKAVAAGAEKDAELAKAHDEIERLKLLPEPAKGVLIPMEKGAKIDDKPATLAEKIAELPPGPAKAAAILASVGSSRR